MKYGIYIDLKYIIQKQNDFKFQPCWEEMVTCKMSKTMAKIIGTLVIWMLILWKYALSTIFTL